MHYIVSFPSTFQNQCNFQCSHRVHIVKVLCLIPPVLSPRPFGRFYAGHHWKHRWNYQLYHSLHFLFRAVSIQSVGEVTSSVTSLLSPSPLPVLCNLHSKCRWNYQLSLSSLPLPPPLIPPFKTSSAYLPKISFFMCIIWDVLRWSHWTASLHEETCSFYFKAGDLHLWRGISGVLHDQQ